MTIVEMLLQEIRDQSAAQAQAMATLAAAQDTTQGAGAPAPGGGSDATNKLLGDILNQMIPLAVGVKELTALEKAGGPPTRARRGPSRTCART